MPFDYAKFYCESAGQEAGLPEGWDEARADWSSRIQSAEQDLTGEERALLDSDEQFVRNSDHHIAAGFIGAWPVEPDMLSDADSRGGVRIGFPGSPDHYTCGVCRSPIRMIVG